jgi:uncharacterized protein (DUF1697 family)
VRHAALLRAVNVGGRGTMAMDELRVAFEAAGFDDVATHGNTGNVVFSSGERSARRLTETIERRLETALGYEGDVFVLTHAQLVEAADANPFRARLGTGEHQCYLAFLSATPDAVRCRQIEQADDDGIYDIAVRGRVLYYAYAREDAQRRRQLDAERILGVRATARSFKVVDRLVALTA